MQNVLVTGASGHLGYNLLKSLISSGIRPSVLFLLEKPPQYLADLNKKIDLLEVNCMDCPALTQSLENIEVIFHTATSGQVHSYLEAEKTIRPEEMISSTENLIRAFHKNKGGKMVFASSYAMGSSTDNFSFDEFKLPYFQGKIGAEKVALRLAAELDANICFVKASMIIGPDDFILTPANNFILNLINNSIRIVPRGGINPVDVRDVVRGLLAVAEIKESQKQYIFAGDDNLYIREFVNNLAKIRDISIPDAALSRNKAKRLASISEWFGDLFDHPALFSKEIATDMVERYAWFDNSVAKKDLDWIPRPLAETLKDTVDFLEKNW